MPACSRRAPRHRRRPLRIGRDRNPEDIELEIAPGQDFADRLAWPLPASVRVSQIRDLASGVIVSSDGLILTSTHVVANIDEAQVRLDDDRRFAARVVLAQPTAIRCAACQAAAERAQRH